METTTRSTRRMHGTRSVPLAAGLLALVLASCGSGGPEALTLTSGGGLSRNSAVAGAEGASADKAMSSMMLWNVEYRVEGTLPDLGDSARAWRVKSVKSSTVLSKARRIAAELGIKDRFVASPDKTSYTAGGTDGVKPNMWVFTGTPESSWSYYAGNAAAPNAAGDSSVSSCATAKDGTKTCDDPAPVEMKPPTNLPSKSEALARATEIIESAGEDAGDFTVTATKDQWGTYVQATIKIGDLDSPYAWWFGFGQDKALTGASGTFVEFARGAEYPLVSTADAVERLNSGQFGYGLAAMSRSVDSSVSSGGATEPEPDSDPAATGDTVPMPEPTVITITGARLSMMPAYLAEGRTVILPAYTFTNADGEVGTVYAIEDKYLKFDDPAKTPQPGGDVVVPDEGGSGSGASKPGSANGGSSGMVDGQGGTDPISPEDPVMDEPIDQKSADALVGLSEKDANALAEKNGWTVRVAERDGESFMLTADYVTDRVNLTIERGKVTKVSVG